MPQSFDLKRILADEHLSAPDREKVQARLETWVGQTIAERLKEKGITKVVFDRNGFLYHGRVRAVAEAARSAGLEF